MSELEVKEVRDAILSGWITTGPLTKKLEKTISEYVGVEKTVCLSSATSAMEMVLRLLGIGEGDEVIVPAYTYTATASVVKHVGATLVMVDSQKDCVEMDYEQLANAITEKTKVIVPVDLGGIVADYEKVLEIVNRPEIKARFNPKNEIQKRFGRIIISADCAHALGARRYNKMAGSIADFSSFSFHAVKNLTTAEGGALTWNIPFGCELVDMDKDAFVPTVEGETWNDYLYRICQLFSLHGQNKDALSKVKLGSWEYDIIGPWYKCNMTDIMAAMALAQYERYPNMLARRRWIIEQYDAAFKNLNVALMHHYGDDFSSSGHLYLVRLLGKSREQANQVIEKMAERGIATNVHYKPLPMMTAYKALGFDISNYPNAYHLFENEITLPLNTKMSDEDVAYVIEHFVEIVKNI
ncbi:MAG: DegT/DnrJ/EryC1/StrS family aminotransferase [Bacteroidales bacterium]|nr:DegT/DnrJ/EryC1/StrS family aminotransferase [Bacteroidales bacterium]